MTFCDEKSSSNNLLSKDSSNIKVSDESPNPSPTPKFVPVSQQDLLMQRKNSMGSSCSIDQEDVLKE